MRIALVSPPIQDFYFTHHRHSALGLTILSHILQDAGHQTHIYNFPQDVSKGARSPLPMALDYLSPFLNDRETGPLSFFTQWHHFGPDWNKCIEQIRLFRADICLINCFAFAYADSSLSLGKMLNEKIPSLPLVLGGAGAAVFPDYFTQTAIFDLVFEGEAESLIPILPNIHSPCQLIDTMASLKTHHDCIPHPALSIRKKRNKKIGTAMLTRGCPRKCRFCSNHLTHGSQFRQADKIELNKLIQTCRSLSHLNLEDDNLLLDKIFFFDFIHSIRKINPDIGFSAENGLDYSLLDEKDINFLINNGFKQFNFSLAVIHNQKSEKRFYKEEKLISLLNVCERKKLPVFLYFIAGLENDYPEVFPDFLMKNSRLNAILGISLFYPVPGLPAVANKTNWSYEDQIRCRGSAAWPWTKSLTTAELVTLFRLTRLVNYLKASPDRALPILKLMMKNESFLSYTKKTGKIFKVENLSGSLLSAFFEKAEMIYFDKKSSI